MSKVLSAALLPAKGSGKVQEGSEDVAGWGAGALNLQLCLLDSSLPLVICSAPSDRHPCI